jgi:hypothetical protein
MLKFSDGKPEVSEWLSLSLEKKRSGISEESMKNTLS